MAITHVQNNAARLLSAGTTLNVTFSGAVAAGNMLFCCAGGGSTGSLAVSDSVNGSYTPIGSQQVGTGGNASASIEAFWIPATLAGTPTVTMTFGTSATFLTLAVGEYAGVGGIESFAYSNSGSVASPAVNPSIWSWHPGNAVIEICFPSNSVTAIASPWNTRQITNFAAASYADLLPTQFNQGNVPGMSSTLNATSDNIMLNVVLAAADTAAFYPPRMPLGV